MNDLPTPTHPFPRERRLRSSGEFRHVREKGKSRGGRYIVMNVAQAYVKAGAPEGDPQPARFGFITSRKVGPAVSRNLVRRRLREVTRLHLPQVRPGIWVVIVARYTAAQANYHSLQEEWLRLARQLGIFPAHPAKPEPERTPHQPTSPLS
jgi:ribonuclease P protein component